MGRSKADTAAGLGAEQMVEVMRIAYGDADSMRGQLGRGPNGRDNATMFCEMTGEYIGETTRALADGYADEAAALATEWVDATREHYPTCYKLIRL